MLSEHNCKSGRVRMVQRGCRFGVLAMLISYESGSSTGRRNNALKLLI